MSSGPQHYAEAERLLAAFKTAWSDVEAMPIGSIDERERRLFAGDGAQRLLAKSQVHATLAQVAAIAGVNVDNGNYAPEPGDEWARVLTPRDPWAEDLAETQAREDAR